MKASDVEAIGRALYPSPNWKARLAKMLEVDKQTVSRWVAPDGYDMPSKYHGKLMIMAEEHKNHIEQVLYRMRSYANEE